VVTADPSGTVTARRATTGTVAWQAPAACPLLTTDYIPPVTLAADGSLIAESVSCDPSTVVRRLDPATGKPRWTWRSPTAANSGNHFIAVGGVARDGAVVLVTGLGDPGTFGSTWSAVGLPNPYPWPSRVGPQDSHVTGSFTLALDAASGRPRWSQASFEYYALTAGAFCGVSAGIRCQDDVTGATTMPDFVPPAEDQAEQAYVANGLAVVTSAPAPGGGVALAVLAVRGGAVTTRAQLAVKPYTYDTRQVYAPMVVAFGALPGGGYLVLLDRRDRPDSPTVALRLGTPG
jgi:outer membrane protein assembly factor BamB